MPDQRPPLMPERLFRFHPLHEQWQMSYAERCALIAVLDELRPARALEIGTAQGGSLAVLARFAQSVVSIDPDPSCRERLAPLFPNVEFVTGYSQSALPDVLRRLQEAQGGLGFVLVDGDHSRAGVRRDVELILRGYQARAPLTMLMHDTFNPGCRAGIAEAGWESCPSVHHVDLDFVTGFLSDDRGFQGQMWGGLGLAELLPEPRAGALVVRRRFERHFRVARARSAHSPARSLVARVLARLGRPR